MVAKIYTGQTPEQEIGRAFKDEMKEMFEAASLELKCPIENLKCRFNNLGQVEIQQMTKTEMVETRKKEELAHRERIIRRRRINYG